MSRGGLRASDHGSNLIAILSPRVRGDNMSKNGNRGSLGCEDNAYRFALESGQYLDKPVDFVGQIAGLLNILVELDGLEDIR